MDEELKKEIIMENYMHPTNRKRIDNNDYIKVNTANASCIDNIDIYIKINNNVIEDIAFDGEACAISISSTSIMINHMIGKNLNEAKEYIKNFYNMCDGKEYNESILNEGIVYSNIYKQGNRKSCATLPYKGLEKVILEKLK